MNLGKTISETEDKIIHEFSLLDSWEKKYEHIIEKGKQLPPFDDRFKTEENKIKGCQSDVWFVAIIDNGRIYFRADSNSTIVKGLAALLICVMSGQTPEAIIHAKLSFIETIGMTQHLVPSRSNGLRYMIMRLKSYAISFQHKSSSGKLP